MTVIVNGTPRPLGEAKTLAQLLEVLGVKISKKAVELNGHIIPSSAFTTTTVSADDQIEIIQFVGGG